MFDRIGEGRWWDRALSLVEGCTPCSPGCDHCWLRSMDRRFHRGGQVRFLRERLDQPKRRRIPTAYAIWSDLFHDCVSADAILSTMCETYTTPRHRFLALTKRPAGALKIYRETPGLQVGGWPPNLWLGVTVCNRDELPKIDPLRQVPAAVRFLSLEPLLGDLGALNLDGIHWVIVGGESGPGARPMHPDWARSIRDQCIAAGVPFVFKQWGKWYPAADYYAAADDQRERALNQRHILLAADGTIQEPEFYQPDPCYIMCRLPRGFSGRLLDGRTWSQLPEVPRA